MKPRGPRRTRGIGTRHRAELARGRGFRRAHPARHAESLLRLALMHSLCADDANDAYQRTMEIFLKRASSSARDTAQMAAHGRASTRRWRSARRAWSTSTATRCNSIGTRSHASRVPTSASRASSAWRGRPRRSGASSRKRCGRCWLRTLGHSYDQICAETGWTYTKVNRCLAEGRRTFLARYAGIEAGAECARWRAVVSAIADGEASAREIADARPHLRNCSACRATIRELHASAPRLAAVFPAARSPRGRRAGGQAAGDVGLIARVYEALSHHVHERAALSALKLQSALDAVGAGRWRRSPLRLQRWRAAVPQSSRRAAAPTALRRRRESACRPDRAAGGCHAAPSCPPGLPRGLSRAGPAASARGGPHGCAPSRVRLRSAPSAGRSSHRESCRRARRRSARRSSGPRAGPRRPPGRSSASNPY